MNWRLVLSGAALVCILSSCQAPSPVEIPLEFPSILIGADWLQSHISSGELIVLDARPREEYDQGHLPGAISLSTQVTFDVGSSNQLPPVPVIEALLSRSGVTHDKAIVVYDQNDLRWAARLFWTLEVHGHTRAAVLDGGLSEWVQGGRPVSTEAVVPEPTSFIANIQPERLASKFDTLQAIDQPTAVLIDTRSPAEYAGMEDRWPRNGHIPGAVNIEWLRNFRPGSFSVKSLEQTRDLYPYEPTTRIIIYCTLGRRATTTYLALRRLGIESAVYHGSWSEWASDPDLPIKKP